MFSFMNYLLTLTFMQVCLSPLLMLTPAFIPLVSSLLFLLCQYLDQGYQAHFIQWAE